jgi:RNA polymerase sigma-70 factor (ECF subfamily)
MTTTPRNDIQEAGGADMADPNRTRPESDAIVRAIREGDESAFTAVTSRYRREIGIYCYRMLGSFSDSEDMVQETYLRAWRRRESFQGRSPLRAWLYAIATNGCLDFLEARNERTVASDPGAAAPPHVPWLQPYPDRLLATAAPRDEEPEAVMVAKETIELAFLVAIQHLPPKQRAVLVLADVLEWSAKEIADLLELSVPSVNSALQRARATMRAHTRAGRPESRPAELPDRELKLLLDRYVDATQRGDTKALAATLRDDVRWSMPPEPFEHAGRDNAIAACVEGGFGSPAFGELRCVITAANRMPAIACYLRTPGEAEFRAFAIDVLRVEDGAVAEVTTFMLEGKLEAFGLPEVL